MSQIEMDQFLSKEKELLALGLVSSDIQGDYSRDQAGNRRHPGCFCGDCIHFCPRSINIKLNARARIGSCREGEESLPADTAHNCPKFSLRNDKKRKVRTILPSGAQK